MSTENIKEIGNMLEEKEKIETLVSEYDEMYQTLIRDCMTTVEKEFETFILSLIM